MAKQLSYNSRLFAVALIVALASIAVCAKTYSSKPTLVLLDNSKLLQTHSKFFEALKEKGHTLDFWIAEESSELNILSYGEYIYDNIVLFAPSATTFSGNVSASTIIEFIDSGRNVLVGVNPSLTEATRDITKSCGTRFLDSDSYVTDHFNYVDSLDGGDHTAILLNNFPEKSVIFDTPQDGLVFEGIAHVVDSRNPWVFPILKASETAYSVAPGSVPSGKIKAGSTLSLISVMQARNNARVSIVGSLDLFSNKFFDATSAKNPGKVYGNKQFALQLTDWTFKDRGLLRTSNLRHFQDDKTTPALYTVKQDLHASVDIQELVNGEWVPYEADNVQMEFVMLDPYVRLGMEHNKQGVFGKTFQIPDVYGVFTLHVTHHRLGYSWIDLAEQVTVRPFRHDQFERFIVAAYPYYAGNFSMMLGFFVFGVVFLYHSK